jgi:hypothetical protein
MIVSEQIGHPRAKPEERVLLGWSPGAAAAFGMRLPKK